MSKNIWWIRAGLDIDATDFPKESFNPEDPIATAEAVEKFCIEQMTKMINHEIPVSFNGESYMPFHEVERNGFKYRGEISFEPPVVSGKKECDHTVMISVDEIGQQHIFNMESYIHNVNNEDSYDRLTKRGAVLLDYCPKCGAKNSF